MARDPEKRKASSKRYYEAHKEYYREYWRKNADKRLAYQQANRERLTQYNREWAKRNPERAAAHERKKKYGLTAEQFEAMKAAQDGRCAICGEIPEALEVDHCHASSKVRALLCGYCNRGLGQFRDNLAVLEQAVLYLKRHSESGE